MKDRFLYLTNKDKKKVLSCKSIDLPIYKCKIKLLFGKNAKILEKDWNKEIGGGAQTRNYLQEEGMVSISFYQNNPPLEYIVHELHHATDMIMDYIGHKRNPDGDEPSAYLIGYLIKEFNKIKKIK